MKNHDANSIKAIKTAYISIASNAFLAIAKGLAGIFGNSYALIADAVESTTDIFSSVLVVLGLKYAAKPPDKNHPYGHGKIEPLVTFIVVGILLIAATYIFIESVHNLYLPQTMPEPYTLVVLATIILYKEVSYRYVLKKSKETNSTSLNADAWHHRSDAITSLLAFIGISAALILGEGYETADDWAALVASFFIVYNAYLIFRPALGEIMDEDLHEELVEKIRKETVSIDGVVDTEKCHVRKMGMKYLVDLHVIVDGDLSVTQGHTIAHQVKDHLRTNFPEVADILIHIEPK